MKKILSVVLLWVMSATVLAAAGDVERVLEQQRQHGFTSPQTAIQELEAVRDHAGPGVPLALRARFHSALASLYIGDDNQTRVEGELQQLERMASTEQCEPCRYHQLIREAQWSLRRTDTTAALRALAKLDALPVPTDVDILQPLEYMRASAADTAGDHDRAIGHAIRAADLALAAGVPAEQVRSLNMLLLANVGRRDLQRADSLAEEAYALAERIGFVYMMAYIRGNQGWIYSLSGEPEKQFQALTDALRIARSVSGMADAELIILVNLAEYQLGQKNFRQAEDLASQAVGVAEQQQKPIIKAVAVLTLGNAQVELGETEAGIGRMRESTVLLESLGAGSYLVNALNDLADAYERLGRNGEALATLRKATSLKEAAITEERDKAATAAQEEFSAERKDYEIERLSLENLRRQAEVSARTWQQRLWAAAAVALALGGVLLIQVVKRTRSRNRLLEDNNAALNKQSVRDPLTGAFNRRHCNALMSQQEALISARSHDRKYKACVGLMLLDVDNFKLVNDSLGHASGDVVLVEIARRLQDLVRKQDTVVRWGGEEFVLVLPGTAPAGMKVLAERVLNIIGSEPVMVDGKPVAVTVSLGCAAFPLFPGQSWEDGLQVADFAMYLAKDRGRNRAVCVMEVDQGAQADVTRGDFAAAEASGQVALEIVEGPRQPLETVLSHDAVDPIG